MNLPIRIALLLTSLWTAPLPVLGEDLVVQCVVRDEHHKRIDDLKPEEIEISEDGKPVSLKGFTLGHGGPGRLSVLMDAGSNESVSLAREGAADANANFSLWDVKQVALLQDFTADGNVALAKKADIPPQSKGILERARRLVDSERRQPWFALMFALIEQQGEAPGRKEIVYFAANGEDGALTEQQIAALGSNALRAGVSIYIFELSGASAQAEAKAAAMLAGKQHGVKGQVGASQNKWRELARRTGGLYATGSKENVRDLLRRAGEDLGTYYEATYTPSAQTEDGHFRPLTIKVSRPRAVVQSAVGYFSVPQISAFNLTDYEPPMLQALHAGGESDQLHFDSQILHFGRQDGKTKASLVVEVPRSAVYSVNDEAEKLLKVHFSVLALIRSADGTVVSRFSQDVPYETALEHASAAPKNLFTLQRQMFLGPGEYRAEVAVADQNGANLGHRSIPFSIAKQGSSLTVGDVVLIRGVEPRTASEGDDPLRFGAQSIIPWAAATIRARKGGELPVLLKVFGDPAVPVTPDVQLKILRGGDVVANLPLLVSGGKEGQYQALVWLPEDSLEAGHYTLVAQAEQGQASSEERREFDYVSASGAGEVQETDNGPDVAPKQLLSEAAELIAGAKRPTDAEIAVILQAARERALDYKKGLPNFSCLQTNKRFASKTGIQNWKAKDTITELLRYSDGKEEHQILEINGVSKAIDRSEVKGLMTKGEFGEFLDAVYSPDAQADFTWQGRTLVDGQEAHVFAYKVKRANSIYSLSTVDGLSRVASAFHGVIHIDANTLATRFVSIEAEDIPVQSLYRESAVSVSYGYFTFSGQKFLLPKSAALSVRVGKRLLLKDEMLFGNYRKYGATSNLITQ